MSRRGGGDGLRTVHSITQNPGRKGQGSHEYHRRTQGQSSTPPPQPKTQSVDERTNYNSKAPLSLSHPHSLHHPHRHPHPHPSNPHPTSPQAQHHQPAHPPSSSPPDPKTASTTPPPQSPHPRGSPTKAASNVVSAPGAHGLYTPSWHARRGSWLGTGYRRPRGPCVGRDACRFLPECRLRRAGRERGAG